MKVSVIIPTYNGVHKLNGIIQALGKQRYKNFEVIIVVDGSTDNTITLLQSIEHSLPALTIIEQANKGRSAVRNMGATSAKGELLVFFDDDMLPLEDCIEQHVNHHLEYPRSILTGGLSEEITSDSKDILKYRAYLSQKWNRSLQVSESGQLSSASIFITAANFSIPNKLFQDLGGFDEKLNDAEDFDFAIKAYKSEIPLYFNESAFAWHNDIITCRSYIKRHRQYMVAHKKLAVLKPWIEKEGFRKPLVMPQGLKRYVFRFFCHRQWIEAVEKEWLKYLPKTIKYKLYDLIITANGVYYPEIVRL